MTRSITSLPPELIGRILSHLPRSALANLSLTCRSFNGFAKSSLYALIITDPQILPGSYTSTVSGVPDVGLRGAGNDMWDRRDRIAEQRFQARKTSFDRLAIALIKTLNINPRTRAFVKALELFVIQSCVELAIELLELVSAYLTTLRTVFHDETSVLLDETPAHIISRFHVRLKPFRIAPLGQLVTLSFRTGPDPVAEIEEFMRIAPNLRHLEVVLSKDCELPEPDDASLWSFDPESQLRYLCFKDVELYFLLYIALLVSKCPFLERLVIHSLLDEGEMIPLGVAQHLRNHPSLEALEWIDVSNRVPLVEDGSGLFQSGFAKLCSRSPDRWHRIKGKA